MVPSSPRSIATASPQAAMKIRLPECCYGVSRIADRETPGRSGGWEVDPVEDRAGEVVQAHCMPSVGGRFCLRLAGPETYFTSGVRTTSLGPKVPALIGPAPNSQNGVKSPNAARAAARPGRRAGG